MGSKVAEAINAEVHIGDTHLPAAEVFAVKYIKCIMVRINKGVPELEEACENFRNNLYTLMGEEAYLAFFNDYVCGKDRPVPSYERVYMDRKSGPPMPS